MIYLTNGLIKRAEFLTKVFPFLFHIFFMIPTKHRVDLKTSKRCQVVLAKSCPKVDYFLVAVCHLCQSPHNPKDVFKSTRTDRNKTTFSHLFVYYLVPPTGFVADFCINGWSWLVGNYSNNLVASITALICIK